MASVAPVELEVSVGNAIVVVVVVVDGFIGTLGSFSRRAQRHGLVLFVFTVGRKCM